MKQKKDSFFELFEYAPIPLIEEDLSESKIYFENALLSEFSGVNPEEIDIFNFLDEHPEIILESQKRRKINNINQAALKLIGIKNKENLNVRRFPEIFVTTDPQTTKKLIIAFIKGNLPVEFETQILTPAGQKRTIIVSLNVPPGYETTLTRVTSAFFDINEQKELSKKLEKTVQEQTQELRETNRRLTAEVLKHQETEKKLKLSEERLKDIALSSGDLIWEIDKNQRFMYMAGRVKELFGLNPEEMINNSFFDFFQEEENENMNKILQQLFQSKKPIANLEYWLHIKKLNKKVYLLTNATPILDSQGNLISYRGTDKDITKQKLAEKVSIESEQRYQALASSSLIGIFRTDLDGNIIYLNDKCGEICGISSGKSLKETILKHIHPDDQQELIKKCEQALNSHVFDPSLECRLQQPDGNIVWIVGQLALERDEENKPIGFVGTVTDRTTQHLAQEKLELQKQQLIHLECLNIMNEMTTSTAKQLKQPLNVISTYAQECTQQMFSGHHDQINNIIKKIELNTQRASKIIQQTEEKFKTGRLRKRPENPNEIIEETIKLVKIQDLKDIHIVSHLINDPPSLPVDKMHIEQALFNIIQNAVEAIEGDNQEKGKITIETQIYDHLHLFEIIITDTGPGISESIQDKIFEPFFTTKPDALGMGLTIANSIIEAHKGYILVTKSEELETQFRIRLPF